MEQSSVILNALGQRQILGIFYDFLAPIYNRGCIFPLSSFPCS
jgi:hypothetical protein